MTNSAEHTVLDEIINDQSLLAIVISDETTDPGLVSTLSLIQQEQEQAPLTTETCGNQADDDGDGATDEEDCTPTTSESTEICGNQADDDGDGATDEEGCIPPQPVSEICGNGIDDNGDGATDEEGCIPPPAEICDNQVDDDSDGKIDIEDEDCIIVQPTVLIESAVDEEGNSLSSGDLIAPQEVTFKFSAQASETSQAFEEEGPQDYQFECALDDQSFIACNSPMTYVMEKGKHDFVVRLVP